MPSKQLKKVAIEGGMKQIIETPRSTKPVWNYLIGVSQQITRDSF